MIWLSCVDKLDGTFKLQWRSLSQGVNAHHLHEEGGGGEGVTWKGMKASIELSPTGLVAFLSAAEREQNMAMLAIRRCEARLLVCFLWW